MYRSNPRISYAALRDLLQSLGVREVRLSKDHVAFQHDSTDMLLAIPTFRPNQQVAPRHLVGFRAQLDARGILDSDEFDRRVASAALRQPA